MKLVSIAAAGLAGVALVLLAVIGTADVIGSQFLGRPVPGTVEIGSSLMVAGIALGLPLAQFARRHVRVEIFIDRLPPRSRAVLDFLAQLCLAVMLAGIAWLGWRMFLTSLATNEFSQGLIEVPMWPARLALALGATLAVVQTIVLALRPEPVEAAVSQI
jgi:TRAP-type C4-dicarboxylate transport system permease small subunit